VIAVNTMSSIILIILLVSRDMTTLASLAVKQVKRKDRQMQPKLSVYSLIAVMIGVSTLARALGLPVAMQD